mmetsp:Transcript_28888/g.52338  ORF Transcript_28888/g.52338 Transcript_28888/m.52338 type:complete len:212 (+) Transcript_28888:1802-2437(+)
MAFFQMPKFCRFFIVMRGASSLRVTILKVLAPTSRLIMSRSSRAVRGGIPPFCSSLLAKNSMFLPVRIAYLFSGPSSPTVSMTGPSASVLSDAGSSNMLDNLSSPLVVLMSSISPGNFRAFVASSLRHFSNSSWPISPSSFLGKSSKLICSRAFFSNIPCFCLSAASFCCSSSCFFCRLAAFFSSIFLASDSSCPKALTRTSFLISPSSPM